MDFLATRSLLPRRPRYRRPSCRENQPSYIEVPLYPQPHTHSYRTLSLHTSTHTYTPGLRFVSLVLLCDSLTCRCVCVSYTLKTCPLIRKVTIKTNTIIWRRIRVCVFSSNLHLFISIMSLFDLMNKANSSPFFTVSFDLFHLTPNITNVQAFALVLLSS